MAPRNQKPAGAEAAAPVYEPETLYEVTLTRIVPMPGDPDTRLSPAHSNKLKGKVLAQLDPEAVADAQPV